jgi:hypothetical protein
MSKELFELMKKSKLFLENMNDTFGEWLLYVSAKNGMTTFNSWGIGKGYETKEICLVDMTDFICWELDSLGIKYQLSYFPETPRTSAYYNIKKLKDE